MKSFLLFISLFPCLLYAQYTGGQGDGHDKGAAVQLDLVGTPQGNKPLFGGGQGDGQHCKTISLSLDGVKVSIFLSGGKGDGFDKAVLSTFVSGEVADKLFSGGSGDGFDKVAYSAYVSGDSANQLFSGGIGDGFDKVQISAFVDGQDAGKYLGGGSGDGFDKGKVASLLNGDLLDMLFSGGLGDGFDKEAASAFLNGKNASDLFSGGPGDGFDKSTYSGRVIHLPVALLSFDAFPEEKFVLVQWVTESEYNNDFFTVERAKDGTIFEKVGSVPSQGDGEEIRFYELTDSLPHTGRSYYRLKQTDKDGQFSYSELVEVIFKTKSQLDLIIYPNPNDGKLLSIRLEGLSAGQGWDVKIVNMKGQVVYVKKQLTRKQETIDLQGTLPAGAYTVVAHQGGKVIAGKLVIVY